MSHELTDRERADRAEKLLHDLTPMGSDYYSNPEKCARWISDEMGRQTRLIVKVMKRAHKAEAEAARLRKRIEQEAISG